MSWFKKKFSCMKRGSGGSSTKVMKSTNNKNNSINNSNNNNNSDDPNMNDIKTNDLLMMQHRIVNKNEKNSNMYRDYSRNCEEIIFANNNNYGELLDKNNLGSKLKFKSLYIAENCK